MNNVRIAIVGVGNCASSLVQGIHYYGNKNPWEANGLMHWDIGGYTPGDIQVVAAFDIVFHGVNGFCAASLSRVLSPVESST